MVWLGAVVVQVVMKAPSGIAGTSAMLPATVMLSTRQWLPPPRSEPPEAVMLTR